MGPWSAAKLDANVIETKASPARMNGVGRVTGVCSSLGNARPIATKKNTSEMPRKLAPSLSAGARANARIIITTDAFSRPSQAARITTTTSPAIAMANSVDFIASGSASRSAAGIRSDATAGGTRGAVKPMTSAPPCGSDRTILAVASRTARSRCGSRGEVAEVLFDARPNALLVNHDHLAYELGERGR